MKKYNKEETENNLVEIPKAQDRLEVLAKIEEYEKKGFFDIDVEEDPPTIPIKPGEVDFLRKKLSSKIKRNYYFFLARKFLNNLQKKLVLQIKEIKGLENLKNLESGAIITCNHFNSLDTFATQVLYDKSKHKKRKLYRVVREGNYTNFPGLFGKIMKHCDTLPLSSNRDVMKEFINSINYVLKNGHFVLVYAEQAMWWNYRKPRPLKKSAFKFAVTNNVPVLPVFITMQDSNFIGPDGFPIQEYTIHVDKPIYADNNLSLQENVENMKNKNFEVWKNIYEITYKIPLTYLCDKIE